MLTVVDNDVNDADPANGIILLEDLPLGSYTVTEVAAPAGYEVDPTPQIMVVDSSATVTLEFTNKPADFRKEFTDPMVWTGKGWEPVTTPWVPLGEQIKWAIEDSNL